MRRLANFLLFSVFSAAISYLGSFGRIVADEYCMCSRLMDLGDNPLSLALEFNGFLGILVQTSFAHWTILNFGQSIAFSLVHLLLLWALWFFSSSLLRAFSSLSAQVRFRTCGIISLGLIIFLAAPAGFGQLGAYEALTQQTFLAQTLFRYPGLVVSLAVNLFLLGLLFLLKLDRVTANKPLMATAFVVGLLAGSMSYYLAAVVFFITAFMVGRRFFLLKRMTESPQISLPSFLLLGLATSLILSLASGPALARISSMAAFNTQIPINDRFPSILLDAVWFASSPLTVPALFALFLGWVIQTKFDVLRFMAFGSRDLAVFTAWYTLFFAVTLLAAAAVSYSAPWHLLLPRALAMFLFVAWGAFLSSFVFSQRVFSRSAHVSLVAVMAVLSLLGSSNAVVWAHQLPSSWASGPLPLQTVLSGVGSGIVWSDTEDQLNLECYRSIESRLKEKKLYLGN